MSRAAKVVKSAAVERGIALDFAPLLAPFKKNGRLSLRVERLAPKARFSRGARNNDGASWSLASDELEDLTYQLAQGYEAEHTLSVRIIALVDGKTLAVREVVVAPDAVRVEAVAAPVEVVGDDTQAQALQAEVAMLRAELAQARTAAQQTVDEAAAHLNECRASWSAENDARVAKLEAAAQTQRAALQATFDKQIQDHETVLTALRGQLQHAVAAKGAAEARAAEVLAKAALPPPAPPPCGHDAELSALRERVAALPREAQEALAKAERAWSGETARLLAEAELRAKDALAKAVAQALSDVPAPAPPPPPPAPVAVVCGHDEELKALRDRLAALQREAAGEGERLAAAEAAWRAALPVPAPVSPPAPPPPAPAIVEVVKPDKAAEAALAAALARAQAAEAALIEARRAPKSDGFAERELGQLRAKLAKLEAELVAALPVRRASEAPNAGQPSRVRDLLNKAPEAAPPNTGRLMRDIVVAGSLGVAAVVFFYPNISPFVFGAPPAPVAAKPQAAAAPVPIASAPEAAPRKATLMRDAKLRARPTAGEAVVAKVSRGGEVVVLEEHDKWVRVRAEDSSAKADAGPAREGWVLGALLSEAAPAAKAPVLDKGK